MKKNDTAAQEIVRTSVTLVLS